MQPRPGSQGESHVKLDYTFDLNINWHPHTIGGIVWYAVRGLEEHVRVSLIFAIVVSFTFFTVLTLILKNCQFTIHVDS
jgi:hypothetical protein